MARTLIANGYVVSVDPSRNIFPNGFVAIDGFDIVAVGAAAQMPPRDGAARVRRLIEGAEEATPESAHPLIRELPPADPYPARRAGALSDSIDCSGQYRVSAVGQPALRRGLGAGDARRPQYSRAVVAAEHPDRFIDQ